MARRDREEEELPERDPKSHRRGAPTPRMSITLPEETRRKVRLASAMADMTENEWAREVLVAAATRTVKKHFPHLLK